MLTMFESLHQDPKALEEACPPRTAEAACAPESVEEERHPAEVGSTTPDTEGLPWPELPEISAVSFPSMPLLEQLTALKHAYCLLGELGTGSYGTVYKCLHRVISKRLKHEARPAISNRFIYFDLVLAPGHAQALALGQIPQVTPEPCPSHSQVVRPQGNLRADLQTYRVYLSHYDPSLGNNPNQASRNPADSRSPEFGNDVNVEWIGRCTRRRHHEAWFGRRGFHPWGSSSYFWDPCFGIFGFA